jgi:hypothetical protein
VKVEFWKSKQRKSMLFKCNLRLRKEIANCPSCVNASALYRWKVDNAIKKLNQYLGNYMGLWLDEFFRWILDVLVEFNFVQWLYVNWLWVACPNSHHFHLPNLLLNFHLNTLTSIPSIWESYFVFFFLMWSFSWQGLKEG